MILCILITGLWSFCMWSIVCSRAIHHLCTTFLKLQKKRSCVLVYVFCKTWALRNRYWFNLYDAASVHSANFPGICHVLTKTCAQLKNLFLSSCCPLMLCVGVLQGCTCRECLNTDGTHSLEQSLPLLLSSLPLTRSAPYSLFPPHVEEFC